MEKLDRANWVLEIICLVGEMPQGWNNPLEKDAAIKQLDAMRARLVFYDDLLHSTHRAYGDYLQQHKKIDKLWEIFRAIEDYSSQSESRSADTDQARKKVK